MPKSVFHADPMAAMTEGIGGRAPGHGMDAKALLCPKRGRGDREEGPRQQRAGRFTDRERKGKGPETLMRSPVVKLARLLHHNR